TQRLTLPLVLPLGAARVNPVAALSLFHPAIAAWFARSFAAPTPAQEEAWPAIQAGRHVLLAAPTGSGKTLAAFLAAIDDLVKQGLAGGLEDQTQIVYVSPLKALSNDIKKNLEIPLAGIREELAARGLPDVAIRTQVRTGDTPQAERAAMRKLAPHILVTTPESLYVLLGSQSGRQMLAGAKSVIVDEIHAVAPNKRGSHLALTLERLEALCGSNLQRIGLSATQKPIELVANFLVGARPRRRAAPQGRQAQGARRHRLIGARHRYRRCRSRQPDRLAARDRDVLAARRPLRPCRRRHAQGPPLPAVARRACRMRRAPR